MGNFFLRQILLPPVIFIPLGIFILRDEKIFGGKHHVAEKFRGIRQLGRGESAKISRGEAIRCNNRFFLEGEGERERETWSVMEHLAGVITFRGPDTGEKSKSTTDILDARKIFPFRCFLPHFLPPLPDIQISILSGHTCALDRYAA